ncbi:trimethylamine methyltransferase [Candidatus Formimonas warabiya]|uniref:Methyltransferase n=2 Tax=Formimonas warabiya TaxID=1761012 RepID=A0A3G1L0K5_FORW1|nr:trimethylamine methyltransferase [Candidatus Formimonas warabiya]
MEILAETGVKFYHPEVLDLLQSKGIKVVGETAFFKEDQVMDWISKAPSLFKIYARNPKYDMLIGQDRVEYVSCNSGFPWIADFEGTRRKAVLQDYFTFVKLVNQTPFFNMNGGVMVTPSDLTYHPIYPIMLVIALTHSDKCMFGGLGGAKESEMIMDILQIVFGRNEELVNKPRIVTIISPLSPLQFDRTMLDTLLIYARFGQPMIIAPAVMAGTTGPVTLAGSIALSNAESLAGVVVSQMVREGTPVIYGSASSASDLKTASFSIGSPESALCAAYCARLAKSYGLPCRGGGTLNDAKSVSVQAGYEGMMVMLVAAQEKINFILHSAGALDSYGAMSFEKYIVDLEIVGMVDRFVQGVKMDHKYLALDVIKQVGPGGEFLSHPHTMEFCRKELWGPDISSRGPIKGKEPNEYLKENINKKKLQMLESYSVPKFPAEVKLRLLRYLVNSGADPEIINCNI